MISLSVVIPAYNAAPYIRECLSSVTCQENSTKTVEIIVVVDGATDETLAIARGVASGYEGIIRIINQKNLGASAARNRGASIAKGRYITFLDADDLWRPNFLATILPLLTHDPDLIEYDAGLINKEGSIYRTLKIACATTDKIRTSTREEFLNTFRCYAWARVYRTSMIYARPFPTGRRFEDVATTPWHYWDSQYIISIGHALLSYRQHEKSILATPQIQDILDISEAIKDASSMYFITKSSYWQIASHRLFQFACRRTTFQPFSNWRNCLNSARVAIQGVPPPPGPARWLQANATHLYTALIFLRSHLKIK